MSQSKQTTNAPLPADGGIELSQIIKFEEETDSIWIVPVCDHFGISYDSNRKLILNDPFLESILLKKSNYFVFNDHRKRLLLPKKGFLRWIQLINAKSVKPELREKFIQFQHLCIDYLFGHAENQATHAELYKEYLSLVQQRSALNSRLKAVKKELDLAIEQRMLGLTATSGQHSLAL